jgi:hypothetical protein
MRENGGGRAMKKKGAAARLLFIAAWIASLAILSLTPLWGQKDISETENRGLTHFPALTVPGFVDGSFQDALEKALGDQMLFSEEVRSTVRSAESAALDAEQEILYRLNPSLKSGYVQISPGYYAYGGDEHRLVEKPNPEARSSGLQDFAEAINALNARRFLYFIENSRSVNFDRPEESRQVFEEICRIFQTDAAARFAVEDYADYCRWFYQTDHHWNHLGSYRGYREIMGMLKPEDRLLEPDAEVELPVVFNGSYARQTKSLRADEHFTVYSFSLPSHTETLNGKRGVYGRMSAYLKGRYAEDSLTNHYANCYGGEYGEIIYDFARPGAGSLLLIASSYSNPINGLIASHYDKTYVIDLRYYEEWAGRPFDIASYAAEKEIDDVLLLGDIEMFLGEASAEGGET